MYVYGGSRVEIALMDATRVSIWCRAPNVASPAYFTYRNPSLSTYWLSTSLSIAPVGGKTDPTNTNSAFSGESSIRLRSTNTNWPTLKSLGHRNLCLSNSSRSLPLARSAIMGILPGNFARIREDSAARCSNGFLDLKDVPVPTLNMGERVFTTLVGVTFGFG